MSMINVLAVVDGTPVKTKSGLTNLIKGSADTVTLIPIDIPGSPWHEAVRGNAYGMPVGIPVTVHSPTNRKWSAEITRTEYHGFSVK